MEQDKVPKMLGFLYCILTNLMCKHLTIDYLVTTGHSMLKNVFCCSSRDPGSVLGGVRLPPDTEIIKYTSSIVGPKVPGTTNRGRKKTISLDPPSVSVTPTIASSAVNMDRLRKNKHVSAHLVLRL